MTDQVESQAMQREVTCYLREHRERAPNAADAFDEFMSTLPLEQKYATVRFCMSYGIYPDSPEWVAFAAARQSTDGACTSLRNASAALDDRLAALSRRTKDAEQAVLTVHLRLLPAVQNIEMASRAAQRIITDGEIVKRLTLIAPFTVALLVFVLAVGGYGGWWFRSREADAACSVTVIREKTRMLDNLRLSARSPVVRRFLDDRKTTL